MGQTTCRVIGSAFSARDREKATERQKLAGDVALFERKAGKVQILGTTGIDKKGISHRRWSRVARIGARP